MVNASFFPLQFYFWWIILTSPRSIERSFQDLSKVFKAKAAITFSFESLKYHKKSWISWMYYQGTVNFGKREQKKEKNNEKKKKKTENSLLKSCKCLKLKLLLSWGLFASINQGSHNTVFLADDSCSSIKKSSLQQKAEITTFIQIGREVWHHLQCTVTWLKKMVLAWRSSVTTAKAQQRCVTASFGEAVAATDVTFITQEPVCLS